MNNIFERIFMKTEDRHIKTCSECKFFDSRGKGSGSICRRHAPSTVRYAHSPYIEDADGKIDPEKFEPITFDPVHHLYRKLGPAVGTAFMDGGKLK